jgi:putative glutamine amidotransferase
MRPAIGITSDFVWDQTRTPARERATLLASYADAVLAAGGLPLPLPVLPEPSPALLDELLACLDGLLLTGGDDLDPQCYGQPRHPETHLLHERRQAFDLALFRRADERRLPTLAICLGFQVVHVVRGGQLVQHVDDRAATPPVAHRGPGVGAFHPVRITPGSVLHEIVGTTELEVNSRHHQAADPARPGRGLRSVAESPDGLLEASEDCDRRFVLAVQWHPEDLIDRTPHLRLFEALVARARRP